MLEINRNNLDRSASPYLRQHQDNPVWWQEWTSDVLETALQKKMPLFVSVGYSTCHWCHVMAAKTFSDPVTADLLNQNFICIKIDREMRPDIDQYLMQYTVSLFGRGGWPLNVFLTPEQQPVYSVLYAPPAELQSTVSQVLEQFLHRAKFMHPFKVAWQPPTQAEDHQVIKRLLAFQDLEFGGFGKGAKFPPHSTLLFLLYQLCVEQNDEVEATCRRTLDMMLLRGLTDHLQGGIFRYCVDRAFTIPHFEKMLYDQAMALWCYSLAAKVFQDEDYRRMALRIADCLDDSLLVDPQVNDYRQPAHFEQETLAVFSLAEGVFKSDVHAVNALYYTALDADTNHEEGATYLFTYDELAGALTDGELAQIHEVYDINPNGNFEGKIHLLRKNSKPLDDLEAKLLAIRRQRPQPQRDEKILCGLNALAAIALLQAGRHLDMPVFEKKAARIMRQLLSIFWDGKNLGHSLSDGRLQKTPFLFDAAAMLLASGIALELHPSWKSVQDILASYIEQFRKDGVWYESLAEDFAPVAASWYDHPIPSGVSMAETALIRTAFQTGRDTFPKSYAQPHQVDFFNIGVMISKGLFHVITREKPLPWSQVKPNTIQINGHPATDCYRGVCTPLTIETGAEIRTD